jgi:hypothetical protein
VQLSYASISATAADLLPLPPPLQLVAPTDLEAKFAALEGSNVDDELSKMKAQLGVGKRPAGQVRWDRVLHLGGVLGGRTCGHGFACCGWAWGPIPCMAACRYQEHDPSLQALECWHGPAAALL